MALGARKDWVVFARYAGSRLNIEGGELRILNDDEILGNSRRSRKYFVTSNTLNMER